MERMTKDKLKTMDTPKELEVVGDARPLIDPRTGKEVSEVYEKNKDVILKFGEKDGNVVIRSITVPGHYDDTVTKNMVEYGRKNIGNCPICEKHKQFLQDTQKKIRSLEVHKSGNSWVVDLDPSKDDFIRRVKSLKNSDVAMGLYVDDKNEVKVKKLSFPADKYSRDEALRRAEEARKQIIDSHEKMKETPVIKKTELPPKITQPARKVGLFPNVVDWRKNRRKIIGKN